MSARRTLRALPTVFRIGASEALAYRVEILVWVITAAMPLIMLPIWHTVSEEGVVPGFSPQRLTAYFLGAFVVRQITGAWAAWSINADVRSGALNQRLLRPIHPMWSYAAENVASIPIRAAVAFPVGVTALLLTGGDHVGSPLAWCIAPFAFVGAWAITFLANVIVGTLAMWMHQSIKLLDVWNAGFFVLSGYLIPVALFPEMIRGLPRWLPFPYQLSYPVELITGALTIEEALRQLAVQWAWVIVLAFIATIVWQRGLRRYGAFGG
jgi:ABC-2 type transport system permease protein